ncbi:MAG: nucleotidyl transferase AbiEii/AbiGii toxin family protein [Bacteroidales bacterium]|nr:nucleotidyl transferase AbiEii/AbiGii toxin family protein [Bacteroidales bacterium]
MSAVFDQMMSRYELKTTEDKHNAVHEVMQQITLAALYRVGFFEKAAFYGGTCLRIFHNLQRFSEDLDFSLLEKNVNFSLEGYFDAIINEFSAHGREVVITRKTKTKNTTIESAFLKDNSEIYNIEFQTQRSIKIKIEVDTNPPLGFNTEYKLLLLPFSFMTRCFNLSALFAGKMHAFLFRNWKKRVKGRDWYDLEWYVRNEHKLNFSHLKERCIQSGHVKAEDFTLEEFTRLLKKRIRDTNIDMVKADVGPFVRDANDLTIWSTDYFLNLVELIKFE